ncbi:MAG: hypothetical protein KC416_17005, partial [Myxococcales bacterium]|nr:hypothetical protein [Myxococcales bacterium]
DTDLKVPCEVESLELSISPDVVDTEGNPLGQIDLRNRLDLSVLPAQLAVLGEPGQEFLVTARVLDESGAKVVSEQMASATLREGESVLLTFNFLKEGSFAEGPGTVTERVPHKPEVCTDGDCDFFDDDEDGRLDEDMPNGCGCPVCPAGTQCSGGVCRKEELTRYQVKGSKEGWVNACTLPASEKTIHFKSGDGEEVTKGTVRVPLPDIEDLEFLFYGRSVSDLWISVDGWVSFAEQDPGLPGQPVPIDSPTAPGNTIFPFWDDLALPKDRKAEVCSGISGRSFYVTWWDLCFEDACDTDDSITVSLELDYLENKVAFIYGQLPSGSAGEMHASETSPERADGVGVTIGVSDVTGRACGADACSSGGRCPNGASCGFTRISRISESVEVNRTSVTFTPVK